MAVTITAINQAEICIVPELKHLGLIEQPQSFTAPVIDFSESSPYEQKTKTLSGGQAAVEACVMKKPNMYLG